MRAYKNKSLSPDSSPLDDELKAAAQDQLLSKLCPPSCLQPTYPSSERLESANSPHSPFVWFDDPFSVRELESAIHSSNTRSSPGMDRIDYDIIRSMLCDLRKILLNIYNDLYAHGLFPDSWRSSLLTFIPKPDGRGVRPIALLSCFLKIFERVIYRRFQWAIETRFLFPDF